MNSIIQQLQIEAAEKNSSVVELLRKAKIAASKLELGDFLDWVEKELNGYKGTDFIPDYREIHGDPRGWNPYHGWVPLMFTEDPKTQDLVSKRKVIQSIGTLEELVSNKNSSDNLQMPFSSEANQQISQAVGFTTRFTLMVSSSSIISILDTVRNIILDWSIKLEKEGILGDGISFSQAEKEKAQEKIVYNIEKIENFTGNMGLMKDEASIQIEQNYSENEIKELKNIMIQIKDNLNTLNLDEPKQEQLEAETQVLQSELNSEKPKKSSIRDKLGSIKRILEGATGNVLAQGISLLIGKYL